jgi:hypothetical protein
MKRHNQILFAALVLQIILAAFVLWPRSTATIGESKPLLGDLGAGDIASLIIQDGDGNSIRLSKLEGQWVLPDADDFPCQQDKITELLDKLVAVTSGRLVTSTEASHKRLKVAADDFERKIALLSQDGSSQVLYIGSSPRFGSAHVRVEGQPEAYLAIDLSAQDVSATPAFWVDTAYLRVLKEDIQALTLTNAQGEWTFEQDAAGNWTLAGLKEGEELASGNVTTLVNKAMSITMVEPLGKQEQAAYGMDQPSAVVRIQTEEKEITLQVGAKDPAEDRYVVKSSESPYYVKVAEFNVKDLVEKSRQDLLQPTPTPEASTESEDALTTPDAGS